MKLVLATKNRKKLGEIQEILGDLPPGLPPIEILTTDDFPDVTLPPETGSTFEENALIKAHALCNATGLAAMGDDSGLVVDALGGAPGVYSARYAGDDATDEDNNRKLLTALEELGEGAGRRARFVCAIAVVRPDGGENVFNGTCEGTIATGARGRGGFGYDPVFVIPGGLTMAELSADEKNKISHRGKALGEFKKWAYEKLG